MPSSADPAGAAGTGRLGDRTVNRLGFGAMRLTGTRPFHGGVPRDRATSVAVLRRAVELGVDHWALGLGDHVLVIPGSGRLSHLEGNVGAAGLRLSDTQMARLSA